MARTGTLAPMRARSFRRHGKNSWHRAAQWDVRCFLTTRKMKTIGTSLEDVTIEIRADSDIPTGMVQELIQICQEQGIEFQRFALKATQIVIGN